MSEQESLTSKASENDEKFNASPQPSAEADKTIPENSIIGSTDESDTLIEVYGQESKEDQENHEKTSEDDSSEQTNIRKSRELKSLLALSKEANLDTNISRKRKVVEGHKTPLLKNTSSDSDIKIIKVAAENKHNFKYPVTAEAELEEEIIKNETNISSDNTNKLKRKRDNLGDVSVGGATEESKKNRKTFAGELKMFKANKDAFCWRCHRSGVNVACETCPRSYHQKCLKQTINNPDHWPCPECVAILKAENTQTRSEAMKGMPLDHLCKLLKFAVNRMIQSQGSDPFLHPVNDVEFPEYKKYIIQPMDLTMLLNNIKENFYGSTQAFEADAKWLLHNSIIFNSYQSKLTYSAKSIIKVCKQEMTEIENCPNCYMNANTKRTTWFVEVCPKPHLLVWAKLKGFPYWPAKAMTVNSAGMVDVRFFGAHDRAWVHYRDCFLYSEKDPNTFKQKRYDIEKCVKELDVYIQNLRKTYGEFKYAPYRMPLDPDNLAKQLHIFLPKYKQFMSRRKSFKGTLENIAEPDPIKEELTVEEARFSESNKIESSSEEKENKCIMADSPEKESSEQRSDLKGGYSNVDSPENDNDNDVTMEGYGTDDDSVVEIDLERRKAFAGQTTQKMEEDEDDDNDTQVPSNISIEGTPFKGNIKAPGGLSNSGKLKMSRNKSETDNSRKRISTEEVYPQLKLSRRNSDQSVKSDSSRLSNMSDKISRVDISENMEITLGNDDIGCVSISENISPPNGESSRSSSDYSVENKRKPVQVDIDNAEFSISPSNKVKISDQLIKRLSDAGEKIEGVKKSLVETKSQTDILIEKFQGVVQHEVVDFSQPTSSSNDNQENGMCPKIAESNSVVDISKLAENQTDIGSNTLTVPEKEKTSPSKCSETTKETANEMDGENSQNSKYFNKDSITQTSSGVIVNINEVDDGSSKGTVENKVPIQKDYVVKRASNEMFKKQKMIQPSITEFTSIISAKDDKSVADNSSNKSSDEVEKKVTSEMVNIVEEFQQETEALDPVQIDKKKIFNIIHSSLNQVKPHLSEDMAAKLIIPTSQPTSKDSKSVDKSPEKNIQKLENMVGSFTKDVSISVDDSASNSNNSQVSTDKNKINENKEVIKDRQVGTKTSILASSKKRKISPGEPSSSKSKIVKLVPIENILNKTNEEKGSSNEPLVDKSAKGKVVIRKVPVSGVSSSSGSFTISSVSSVHEINQEEIKSEPDSDDDFSETENLEAKRKYLSALNISEKPSDFDKNSANEIRTRAKAEEKREKCKIVDNITRVIDDVALNYSAEHDGEKVLPRKPEIRPSSSGVPPQEGEIFVKSFAKLQTGTAENGKQRARKSFPMPCYTSPIEKPKTIAHKKDPPVHMPKKDPPVHMPKKDHSKGYTTKRDLSKATSSLISSQSTPWSTFAKPHPTTNSANPSESTASTKTLQTLSNVLISEGKTVASAGVGVSPASVGIIQTSKPADTSGSTPTHFFLLPTSGLNYCVPLANTTMNSVPSAPSTSTVTTLQPQPTQQSLLKSSVVPLNLRASQNYIPQGDESNETVLGKSPPANNQLLNDLLSQPLGNSARNSEQSSTAGSNNGNGCNSSNTATGAATEMQQEDEFAILNSILPDNVSKAVSDLLMRPPPKLKPRPPGVLNQVFDEGTPSSAGGVSTRINSIAHRMGDYFRGMLIETLEDLGKCANPEAKIIGLQLELETQKYRHILEMTELRKNVCITLKDIQRSILEEREKVIDETRAACEAEAIKRVELAKSKQWCANCSKEAQFYCCWNTSYCDYPCQQKHWPQHMGKCTQSIEKTTNTTSLPNRPSPQIVLRPAGPTKSGVGRIIAKPTKVYPRATAPIKTYKSISATNNHITVIETTPGSFELVGNGPIAVSGKMYTSSSTIHGTKLKPTNTTSTMPSTSYTLAPAGMGGAPRPSPSTSTTMRSPPTRLPFTIPAANLMDEH